MTAPDIDGLVAAVAAAVEQDYVLPEAGREAAEELRRRHRDGELAHVDSLEAVAASLTVTLQERTNDLHLRLIVRDDDPTDLVDDEGYDAHWAERSRVTAGGVCRVERLPGNLACLVLEPVISHPEHGGQWLTAAMNLVAGADGLVIDVRGCVGGTPDGISLICSYLFGGAPTHLMDITERAETRQFWTLPHVPGSLLADGCPVAVAVSGQTFSGGEQLAFVLQDLGRAVVVGEQTRGGAHPRIGVAVHPRLELALPVARPHSPRTGLNWEGTGVAPDLACPAGEAVDRALAHVREAAGTGR